jgi:MFS superfamily sulfate permease-like transporter
MHPFGRQDVARSAIGTGTTVPAQSRRSAIALEIWPAYCARLAALEYSELASLTWLWRVPAARWLAEYRVTWLRADVVAGVTLAAYAIPVSLAYAGLAGLPPQVGVYGYLLGGLGYALFGSSRQLAIGPTSAISLMIAGTVGAMADGDAQRYAQIASLAGFTVAALCLIAWLLRLSVLVQLIGDSILVGFKAGAGLTIAMTQLPSLIGTAGGGHNFFERAVLFAEQLGQTHYLVLAIGVAAIMLLVLGERRPPGKPVALGVVGLSIVAASVFGLSALGVPTTGTIPPGLPRLAGPAHTSRFWAAFPARTAIPTSPDIRKTRCYPVSSQRVRKPR